MTAIEFLKQGKLRYDDDGQYLWLDTKDDSILILEIRGWSSITALYTSLNDTERIMKSVELQDKIGELVLEALNDKLQKNDT